MPLFEGTDSSLLALQTPLVCKRLTVEHFVR